MTTDLTCYGPDIEALADLAGDFDLRSPVDTRTWSRQAWESIADVAPASGWSPRRRPAWPHSWPACDRPGQR